MSLPPKWRAKIEASRGEMHNSRSWPVADDRAKANQFWVDRIRLESNPQRGSRRHSGALEPVEGAKRQAQMQGSLTGWTPEEAGSGGQKKKRPQSAAAARSHVQAARASTRRRPASAAARASIGSAARCSTSSSWADELADTEKDRAVERAWAGEEREEVSHNDPTRWAKPGENVGIGAARQRAADEAWAEEQRLQRRSDLEKQRRKAAWSKQAATLHGKSVAKKASKAYLSRLAQPQSRRLAGDFRATFRSAPLLPTRTTSLVPSRIESG